MSNRERKRAQRRKRKARSGARPTPEGEAAGAASNGDAGASATDPPEEETLSGVSASELRNRKAREELEPLEPGERPTVVTLGAVLSLLIAASIVIAWIAGAETRVFEAGVEVGEERPDPLQVFIPAVLFTVMAWGMWRARYWAVLGFQAVMAIIMIGAFLALISATSVPQALGVTAVLAVAATFFWFTVKGMARIQMPERRTPR